MPEIVWPRGIGASPMMRAPNMPFGTDTWLCRWAWYMPIAGFSATNSYTNVSPDRTGSWV